MMGRSRRWPVSCALGLWLISGPALGGVSGAAAAAEGMIRAWPRFAQAAARLMIEKYGQPDVCNEDSLVWRNNGPWKRTIVHRHGLPGPRPRQNDVLQQVADYHVPLNKFQELALFDDRLVVDRSRDEISFRSDDEKSNFLALNLADEIVSNWKDAALARQAFVEGMDLVRSGKNTLFTDGLMFRGRKGSSEARTPTPLDP